MKIKRVLLILCFLTIFSFASASAQVSDVDFSIPSYQIDAFIQEDGSVDIVERITYDGSFNGQYREIVYGGNALNHDADESDLDGDSPLYDASSITVNGVYELIGEDNDPASRISYHQVSAGTASVGEDEVYEVEDNGSVMRFTVYSPTYDSEKTLIVEYTLEDVVVVHNDVAELYWSFVGEDWENHLGFVEVNMILPGSSEELRVFAHGPLHGNSELVNDQQARLTIEGLNAGEAVDGRLIFSPNLAASAVKQTDMEALDGILEAEGARAEEANRAREADQRRTTIAYVIGILYMIAAVVLAIFIYLKYDREFKPNFDAPYYRELPNEYSPAVMSYNYYFRKITSKDLTATLLNMVRKGIFKLETEKVEVKKFFRTKEETQYTFVDNSANYDKNLEAEESYVINWIIKKVGDGKQVRFDEIEDYAKDNKSGKTFYDDYNGWIGTVEKEASSYQFFDKSVKKGILFGLLIGVIGIIVGVYAAFNGAYWMLLTIPLGLIIAVYSLTIKRRTKFGTEEYAKWKAFSNFLEDFSKLDDAVVPSVILWEHYLVYAISLGIAEKVIKTMEVVLKESDFENNNLTFMRGYGYAGLYSLSAMNTSLDQATKTAVKAATTSHSSATGGGGGFSSGGGSGGGGGGGGGF